MAFDDSEDQENSGQQAQGAQTSPGQGSTSLSGGGGGFAGQSGGGASGAPGSYSQAPTSSGGWTNLNSYLSANADQSQGIGQTLANTVGQSAQTAQGALQNNVNDYNNQFSSLPTEAQAQTNMQNTLGNTAQDTVGSAPVTQFQGYLNDTQSYNNPQAGGTSTTSATPQTLQTINGANGQNDYGTTQSDYTTAAQNLADTQSESGRDVLLQNQYGQGGQQYNSGEQAFDQLLVEQNPANAQALNSVYQQYNPTVGLDTNTADAAYGTSSDLYNANNAAATKAANVATTNSAIQTDAQNALQSAITTDTGTVNNELTAGQSGQDSNYQALQQALTQNDLTPAQLQELGLTQGQQTYGVNGAQLASYLNPEGSPLNVDQTATGTDFGNSAALQALASGQSYAQSASLGLTGGAPQAMPNAPTFNLGGFNSAVNANQAAFLGDQTALAQQIATSEGADAQTGEYGVINSLPIAQQISADEALINGQPVNGTTYAKPGNWQQLQALVNQYNTAIKPYTGAISAMSNPDKPVIR